MSIEILHVHPIYFGFCFARETLETLQMVPFWNFLFAASKSWVALGSLAASLVKALAILRPVAGDQNEL